MPRKMVVIGGDGSTPILEEIPASNELELQMRLTENPELIPIEEFGLTGPLMVVGRETALPSGVVDLVGLDQAGELLVVEFKTGPQNSDFKHALAQAVDYGSHLWQMSFDEFEATVASKYFKGSHCPDTSLSKGCNSLLDAAERVWGDAWGEEERSQFVERLTGRLESGALHYAVVAQRFTPAMARTATYMNSTMPSAHFYLVEMIRFAGGGLVAFEGRTVLKPAIGKSSSAGGSRHDMDSFLASEPIEARRVSLEDLIEYCTGLKFSIFWGMKGISIKADVGEKPSPLSIGWIHPTGVKGWMGLSGLALGFDNSRAAEAPSMSHALDSYVSAVAHLPGAVPATLQNMTVCIFDGPSEANNLEAIKEILGDLAHALANV